MQLIVIHKNGNSATTHGSSLLRFAISSAPIAGVVFEGLSKCLGRGRNSKIVYAVPEQWGIEIRRIAQKIVPYTENVPICFETVRLSSPKSLRKTKGNHWFVISNGRFATQINSELLCNVLASAQADVVAVNVEPELLGKQEKMQLTSQGRVAGVRRLYSDSAEPAPPPADWPHHIFVRTNILEQLALDRTLPQSYSALLERCRSNALTVRAINVGGTATDLETEDGLLNFCRTRLSFLSLPHPYGKMGNSVATGSNGTSQDPKFVGKVLLGKDIQIGPKVVLVGPTIISNNVKIEQGAVINSSIIGPEVCVSQNQLVQNCIIKEPQCNRGRLTRSTNNNSKKTCYPKLDLNHQQYASDTFRDWPSFSYTRCFKRIADIVGAIIVLIVFAPIMPLIALAIKLSSQGPVFFKDKRQGLHAKVFNCLKLRTMIIGADKIQDKLRVLNQTDGPQFKIADDPRLSAIGRFLRDTYIDEIPQFFNVLLGQMSVVGPRPSPESENTLCPPWRDARLSVRPGITGLWQVCRTRQPMKDFQEWIHYDIKYVKDLSLRMDLWICWQTAKKLVKNFISQF